MSIPDLTTAEKVQVRLSTVGVNLRVDHLPAGGLAECISAASCDVAFYLSRYPLATLPTSDMVANWTADVAVWHLCGYRANPIPASVQKRYEMVLEQLKLVQDGKANIPDLNNAGSAPAIRNYAIRNDVYPSKVTITQTSNPKTNNGWPSNSDRREPPRYG